MAIGVGGARRWGAGLALLLCLAGVLGACAARRPAREAQRSDQELRQSAEAHLQRKRFEEARKDLQRLIAQYPESELVAEARLTTARAYFLEGRYDEARAELQRFLELFPQHDRVDEAHYYLGLAYFKELDATDRDDTPAKKALAEFELVAREFADSPYAKDAADKARICREKLAEKEVYVGTFYFRRERYGAAIGRFATALKSYPGTAVEDQALFYLGESLWRLEQREAAREAWGQLVAERPDSTLAAAAARRLGLDAGQFALAAARQTDRASFWSKIWGSIRDFTGALLDNVILSP